MEASIVLAAYGVVVGIMAGALGGTLAGLAGLGGGLIYMPLLLLTMPQSDSNHVAVYVMGSMLGVLITSAFSARSHWRLEHVDMGFVRQLAPGLVMGAIVGLWLTLHVPAMWVLLALAVLNAWISFDYGREVKKRAMRLPLAAYSGPMGYVSGSLGIGGGTMLVPLLRRLLPLRMAVGTSAMCGVIMAAVAILMNVLMDATWWSLLHEQGLFLGGFCLGLVVILPYTSAWSARLHAQYAEAVIQRVLKVLFMMLSMLFLLYVWVLFDAA